MPCNESSHRSLQPERTCAATPPQTAKLALELLMLGKPAVKTETRTGCVSSGSGWISGPGGCEEGPVAGETLGGGQGVGAEVCPRREAERA